MAQSGRLEGEDYSVKLRGRTDRRGIPMELIRVAASPQAMLNGAAVSPAGRVFSSFPRWTPVPSPSVAEAMADGSFRPFPGNEWNAWEPGQDPHGAIVNAHAVHADAFNTLWVIDDAAPRVCPPVE